MMPYDLEQLIEFQQDLLRSGLNQDALLRTLDALRALQQREAQRCRTCRHFVHVRPVGVCREDVQMVRSVSEDGSGFCHRWEARDA